MTEAFQLEIIEDEIKQLSKAKKEADFTLQLARANRDQIDKRLEAHLERLEAIRQGQFELFKDHRPEPELN